MRLCALLLTLVCGIAWAQDYPNKPVRMVVGFPPGGGTDVVARILSPRLGELLGQPIKWTSVKATLAEHARGPRPRFQRTGHGRYRIA